MPDQRALPEICPFLAAAHDPDSVLSYPSASNRCHKLGDPIEVTQDYQAEYCLRARHWFCPVYTGSVKRPPVPIRSEGTLAEPTSPVPDSAPTTPPSTNKPRPITVLLIGLLLIGVGGTGLALAGRRSETPVAVSTATITPTETEAITPAPVPTDSPTITATFTASATASATETVTPTQTPTETATVTPSYTPTVTPTLRACQVPSEWVRYTVSAGETYYKIATRFGTTVDALQRVNCLSDPGRLLAGQTVYVPPMPTPTGTASR